MKLTSIFFTANASIFAVHIAKIMIKLFPLITKSYFF